MSQLKKVLMPLMLGIGIILVGITILCWSGAGDLKDNDYAKWFSLISGPMGLILLVGAYWFFLEAKRKQRKQ